jgi:hypothetical protein
MEYPGVASDRQKKGGYGEIINISHILNDLQQTYIYHKIPVVA